MVLSLCLAFAGETIKGARIHLELQGVEESNCSQGFKAYTEEGLHESIEKIMEVCSKSSTDKLVLTHIDCTHTRFVATAGHE